ncbi:bacteriocin immunity protein [Pseudomonas sp. BP8]|uniref:bacteriocin immunity protein n=1 Tax=Pseudomonas sp. BP8 TaxID=2817864 RepID=UPI001AE61291|nr:bacteriocin immunity protein [Pseudomonas putida]
MQLTHGARDNISSLDQYDEHSFRRLVEDRWHVETDEISHGVLITHFNRIVGHPAGSDLLFYSETDDTASIIDPHQIVATIKRWHQHNGRAAFKDQILQPSPVHQTFTREQRASHSSTRTLENVRKLVGDIHLSEREAEQKLAILEHQITLSGEAPQKPLAVSLDALRALERAHHQAKRAVSQLQRLQVSVKVALDRARRDAASPFLASCSGIAVNFSVIARP